MRTLGEVCDSIAEICDPNVPLESHSAIEPSLLRRRGEQLITLSRALEAFHRERGTCGPHHKQDPALDSTVWWPLLIGTSLIACLSCYSWWPALSYDFAGGFFMDDAMVKKNANVYEDIDWPRIFRTDYWGLEMFQEGVWTHKSFRPLTVLSFRLNYWLHTFDSSGFHITNILLHAACSALLGMLGWYSVRLPPDWSLLLAVLFFVHPVHTESVLYIVGRADLICLALILLATLIYTPCISDRTRSLRALVLLLLSAVLLVAAGLSKETGFCFFGLVAGWEILRALCMRPSQRKMQQRCWRLGLILALGGAACYWRVWYTGTSIDRMDPQSNSIEVHKSKLVRALSYALLHGIYGKLLVWPSFLCYDYSLDAIPLVHGFDDVRLLLPVTAYVSLGILLTLSLQSLLCRRARCGSAGSVCEGPIVGVATVVLSFMPMSNIIFPVGTMIGERLLYIPSAGLLVSFVSLAQLSLPRRRSRMWGIFLLVMGMAAVWRCMLRIPEWKDSDTITTADGLRQLRSGRVQFNFANVLLQAKRYDEALVTYQRSIDIDEAHDVQDSLPLYHAGQILFYQGNHADAVRYLEKAVTGFYSPLTIKEEEIFHDYALACWFADKPQESITNFQKALIMNPAFTKALNNMGCAMGIGALTGKLPSEFYGHGVGAFDQAVRLEPANILYWRNAIALLMTGGETQRAMTVMQQLVALDPTGGHDVDPPRDCAWEFYFR